MEWLMCHELQLPSVDKILSELNDQAKDITPFEGGEVSLLLITLSHDHY